ncbi:class I SAM-dependent methyltransferase [Neobacillus terrae]|uniref:class I SAM-dependent methyltransferase n=1 Tax=Neobacillus terrae TaxID=3034837 RepID=UPI00140E83A0|nr:class I SAM-dependent methyltransferase [Neobacillus terrae]NHM31465.1 class I SAM-dependent methyltransferase [Neobacillus terrae]
MDQLDKWNKKHKDRLDDLKELQPNVRLKNLSQYLRGGKALDIACGLGGNSVFLAQSGYEVLAVDFSEVATKFIYDWASKKKLPVTTLTEDLTNFGSLPLEKHSYDFVNMTYYLDRSIFPAIKRLLKPNGYFFMETYYLTPNVQKVSDQYKLHSNELLTEFLGWKILYFEENEQEGRQTIFCQK